MVYFYRLRIKHSNHLHTELSLDYLKDTKFYLESKASFIYISSIAPFKPFLIAWLREYCTLRTVPWSANTPSMELFCQKKTCSTIKLFSFFKNVLY